MENDFKIRGYRSCISSAFYAVTNNLRALTLAHWRMFLLLIVCMSALDVWVQYILPGATYVGFELKRGQMMAACAFAFIVYLVVSSTLMSVINRRTLLWNVVRNIKLIPVNLLMFLVYIVLTVVCSVIYIRCSDNPTRILLFNIFALAALLLVVYFVIALPMSYVNMKYMMEPGAKMRRMFFSSYKAGMRSWGFIFVVLFLAMLCVTMAYSVICVPVLVMQLIQNISSMGMATNGDSAGLPWYFMLLYFVISLCVSFVKIYLQLFLVYAMYYVYQTIECKNEKMIK